MIVLLLGILLSRCGDYENSDLLLQNTSGPQKNFYSLVNAFKLNEKERTIKEADNILYNFENFTYPQRYIDLTLIIRADVETWKNNDLEDLTREMEKVKDRLNNRKGGEKTQKIQKDIENKLSKMIKDIEKKQSESQNADELKKQIEDIQNPSPPQDTPDQGKIRGPGLIDKKLSKISESWGKLPEKERNRILLDLRRSLPAKDRSIIENYFKELNVHR